MIRRLLVVLALPALMLTLIPAQAFSDASVVQDSCLPFIDQGKPHCRIYFSVVNFSLPSPVCDLHFIPEPQPPSEGCVMLSAEPADGWSAFLSPFGGADYFANTPGACIDAGTIRRGFSFVLDPDFCCYIVQFTDPTGAVMLEQEECFVPCFPSAAGSGAWGTIKSLYR
jgi:hypothetical protein